MVPRAVPAAPPLPVWVQAVRDVGFPVVVASAFVYQQVVTVPAVLERIGARLERVELAEREKAHAIEALIARIDAALAKR